MGELEFDDGRAPAGAGEEGVHGGSPSGGTVGDGRGGRKAFFF